MNIYLAGGESSLAISTAKHGAAKLYSALNERSLLMKYPAGRLMIDSGAHSWNKIWISGKVGAQAQADIGSVEDWIKDYRKMIDLLHARPQTVFVELDTYGNLDKSVIDQMYADVKKAYPQIEFIRVYHLLLDGGTLEVLKQWIAEGQTYIGIGWDCAARFGDIFRLTRDKVRIHCFACTKLDVIRNYPFYSVDSSTVIAPGRYGGEINHRGQYVPKNKMNAKRGLSVVKTHQRKIEDAVKTFLRIEKETTELWASRGITW